MMIDIATWNTKDWLEAATYVLAIVGALSGAIFWLSSERAQSIMNTREKIQRTWTNEGDVNSQELRFMELFLYVSDGDLVGTLRSPTFARELEVQADIGWRSSLLKIGELRGPNVVKVAEAKVYLTGNKNRLDWKLVGRNPHHVVPKRATLWPVPSSSGGDVHLGVQSGRGERPS